MSSVLHIISGLASGGAEVMLFDLATHDPDNTHIIVSLSGMDVYGERLEAAGLSVYSLNMKRGQISLKGLLTLYRIIRRQKPDIVQTWMYHSDLIGGVVARLAGVSNIVWGIHSGVTKLSHPSRNTRITVGLCARLSRLLPKRIVACSKSAARMHAELGYDREKIFVIRNGYNLSRFKPDKTPRKMLREKWSVGEEDFLLGMVARWDPVKDHANLLEACSRLGENWRLVLIGLDMEDSNSSLAELTERFNLQDRLILLGPRQDIPAIMNALDLHVLSSQAEAFPNVVSEAMACGTPCVVTDVGDAAEIVDDCGWVVPAKDTTKMSLAISKVISKKASDAKAWGKLKQRCRNRIVNNFSLEQMIKSYSTLWNGLDNEATKGI